MTATTTCPRCLSGNHRCLARECACSCRTAARRSPRASKVIAGGVLVADVPRSATGTKPRPKAVKAKGPRRAVGRPRATGASLDSHERKAAGMRAARAVDIDRPAAVAAIVADPTGRTWSADTRRLFAVECDRLALSVHG